ncbi:MAG: site-specific integrase [bacterium]|nr:site-specific integrase [bacterium]
MVKYYLQKSGAIIVAVTINGVRHRPTTKLKVKPDKWVNQRVVGKGSININYELDRISDAVEKWIFENPVKNYTDDQVKLKLQSIIENSDFVSKRKSIQEYFDEFIQDKKKQVNKKTKKTLGDKTIGSYRAEFEKLMQFEPLELEQINKQKYDEFFNWLTLEKGHKISTAGKSIKRLKTFFTWCHHKGLPINQEYNFWAGVDSETDEEDRALNIQQLNRIYELVIDPLDVMDLSKELGYNLDSRHLTMLCESLERTRQQAVAMASIGCHKEDFWSLTDSNVFGDIIKYDRGKNQIKCVAPFIDNHIFHAREFANLSGGPLFERNLKINEHLVYIRHLCKIPFHITAKTFRKTFGSIIYYELPETGVNKLGVIMKAYGHKREETTRRYLGIQDDDLRKDHALLFK